VVAQIAFPHQANGQLIERNGQVIGSSLIGQGFSSPGYFRPRPSAAGTGYDAANSAGSQFGPTNKKLVDAVKANVEAARQENPSAPVPIDLVTTSASGFDPHISPAAAEFQDAGPVATMSLSRFRDAVHRSRGGKQTAGSSAFWRLRVNVLELTSRSMRSILSRGSRLRCGVPQQSHAAPHSPSS
jgi:K+-transporting ATPase ATPase C chain